MKTEGEEEIEKSKSKKAEEKVDLDQQVTKRKKIQRKIQKSL